MSGDGIAGVIAAHRLILWEGVSCRCDDWQVDPDLPETPANQHALHQAEQIRAHLSAVLGEAREDVARAIRGKRLRPDEPASELALMEADAALAVIAARVGVDRERRRSGDPHAHPGRGQQGSGVDRGQEPAWPQGARDGPAAVPLRPTRVGAVDPDEVDRMTTHRPTPDPDPAPEETP